MLEGQSRLLERVAEREREKERMVERHRGSYINEVGQRG